MKPDMLFHEQAECHFDRLFDTHVPHVLVRIFMSLDSDDLERCRLVCHRWRCFIHDHVAGNPILREQVISKRVVMMWRSPAGPFVERLLEDATGKQINWNELSTVAGIAVAGNELFLATERQIIHFVNFRIARCQSLPNAERIDRVYLGNEVVLVQSSRLNKRYHVLRRENLQPVTVYDGSGEMAIIGQDNDDNHGNKTGGTVIFMVHERNDSDGTVFELNKVCFDRRGERIFEKPIIQIRSCDLDVPEQDSRWTNSRWSIDDKYLILVSDNGYLHLIDYSQNKVLLTRRYSEVKENEVKKVILTDTFCGAVYSKVTNERGEWGRNLVAFNNKSGECIARVLDVSCYGGFFISASVKHLVFSYADAANNQHFILHEFSKSRGGFQSRSLVLSHRPPPMRTMQIIRDKLLVLSFYTSSRALRMFDLDRLMTCTENMAELEEMKKLPLAMQAFQSTFDQCHTKKLLLFKETGIFCQRHDYSNEKLILCLTLGAGDGKKRNEATSPDAAEKSWSDKKWFKFRIK